MVLIQAMYNPTWWTFPSVLLLEGCSAGFHPVLTLETRALIAALRIIFDLIYVP